MSMATTFAFAAMLYGASRPWDERLAFLAWALFLLRPSEQPLDGITVAAYLATTHALALALVVRIVRRGGA